MKNNRIVLIVDSCWNNRKVLHDMLTKDYDIIESETVSRAIEVIKKSKKISAVLIDFVLLKEQEYAFMLRLQQLPHSANLPVIVTSQEEGVNIEIEALENGALDFIPKSYDATIIKHRLKNTIKMIENATIIQTLEHDTLTGLYNKEGFYQKITDVLEYTDSQTKFDIVCIDIDNFKLINDMYGEARADDLLVYFARRVEDESNQFGGISCRIGADIFMIFLPRSSNYETMMLADIRKCLDDYEQNLNVTVRFGIYQIESSSLTIRSMCDRAKFACQSIKGKYEIYFAYYDDEIRSRLVIEQEMTNDMKAALRNEEFEVYFQPKYSLLTEKIVGAEALVRWNHPEKGFLLPADFIPLFEKNGFITDLDFYVWEKTCIAIKTWKDKGYTLIPISVNVSRIDLYNPQLPDIISNLVKKYHLKPDMLRLEITETAYTENPSQLIKLVSSLRKEGFVIEMDDFGSKYSSLNMLNEAPVDILKLDMRFLQGKYNTTRSESILTFIIQLAHRLNVSVIAEGIETEVNLDFLRSIGCKYGQGYYFAKPMPLEQFDDLICKNEVEYVTEEDKIPPNNHLNYSELRTLVDYMPGGVFKYRAEGQGEFVFATDTLFRLTGYTRAEFAEKFENKFENFVYHEDRERVLAEINAQIELGEIDYCEYRVETKSGELRWFYDVGHIVVDENNEKWFYVIVVDNTDLKMARESARIEHESYESILPYTKDVIFEWNIKKDEMICTDTFLHKFGYLPPVTDSIKNMQAEGYIHQKDIFEFDIMFANLKKGFKFASCEVRVQKSNSTFLWCKICATAIKDDLHNIARVIGVITDINDSRILLEGIQKKANYDPLTQLQNRVFFEESINTYLMEHGSQGSFIMMDVDDFKYVNDTYGHAAGDRVLTTLADRLRDSFRSSDYITRLGGDEFAVFITSSLTTEALKVKLDVLISEINRELDFNGITYKPSCSIGAINIPKNSNITFGECYERADVAMYESKRKGKNQWYIE